MWTHLLRTYVLVLSIVIGNSTLDVELDDLENTIDVLKQELSFDKDDYITPFNTEKINLYIKKLKEFAAKWQLDNQISNSSQEKSDSDENITTDTRSDDFVTFGVFKKRFENYVNSDAIQKIVFNGKRDNNQKGFEEMIKNNFKSEMKRMVKRSYDIQKSRQDKPMNNGKNMDNAETQQRSDELTRVLTNAFRNLLKTESLSTETHIQSLSGNNLKSDEKSEKSTAVEKNNKSVLSLLINLFKKTVVPKT